jgi:hypothetical protein
VPPFLLQIANRKLLGRCSDCGKIDNLRRSASEGRFVNQQDRCDE